LVSELKDFLEYLDDDQISPQKCIKELELIIHMLSEINSRQEHDDTEDLLYLVSKTLEVSVINIRKARRTDLIPLLKILKKGYLIARIRLLGSTKFCKN
jgi:hypothetical protein